MSAAWMFFFVGVVNAIRDDEERRSAFRYLPKRPNAELGWESAGEFVTYPCSVLDMSIGGCRIQGSFAQPAPGAQVSIKPEGIAEWMKMVVVNVRKPFFGKLTVGLRFQTPLDYERFKLLMYGREPFEIAPPRDAPEHERNHFWH